MIDLDLHNLLQQQLMENEFENQKVDLKTADRDTLFAERVRLKKQMASFQAQANQLLDRLYKLQKYYYDDMVIINKDNSGLGRPWKQDHGGRRWAWWEINLMYLVNEKSTNEVAIRRTGNEDQIKTIRDVCHRLNYLNDLTYDAHKLSKELKTRLNMEFGSFPND